MKKLTTVLLVFFAFPAAAQEALSPMQQYLYNESGYAPPSPQVQQVQQAYEAPPVYAQQEVYVPPHEVYVPPMNNVVDPYYEEPHEEVGPSTESPSLRALMTSSGF